MNSRLARIRPFSRRLLRKGLSRTLPSMYGAAAVAATAQLSAPTTLGELESWFLSLPARDRAEVIWAEPALRAVRQQLVSGPLTSDALHGALCRYLQLTLRMRALPQLLRQDQSVSVAAMQHVRERLIGLHDWLGSPTAATVVDQAVRIVKACQAGLIAALHDGAWDIQDLEEIREALDDEGAIQEVAAQPEASVTCAQLLLLGVIECADRDASPERGRELGRRALVCAINGLRAIRANGISVSLDDSGENPGATLEQRVDLFLEASANCAILESRETLDEFDNLQFAPGTSSQPPLPEPAPDPPAQIQRLVGELIGIDFPSSVITLQLIDGITYFLNVTPSLLDRAIELRSQLMAALVLIEPGGNAWARNIRALRLDPEAGPAIPESGERTREMLQQRDELLRRLAR